MERACMERDCTERQRTEHAAYDTLIVSAGGMFAPAYVGAVRALEDANLTLPFTNYHGTSAGALICTMAACGLTAAEMMKTISEHSQKTKAPSASDILKIPSDWGALDIEQLLGPLLDSFMEPEETFVTLAKRRGVNLSVHAYNVTQGRLVDFSLQDTPEMSIRQAVCASCCVPLMFKPVMIDGSMYVDGAVSQRTPVHMIKKTKTDIRRALVLDVHETLEGPPRGVWQYIACLTAATSRHIDHFDGTFVTIHVPQGITSLLDLPVDGETLRKVETCGYEALKARR